VEQVDRRTALTAAGQLLLRYAQRITALVDEAQVALDERAGGGLGGHVTVGMVQGLNAVLMPYVLRAYLARYPAVHVRPLSIQGNEIDERLLKREMDLGIHQGPALRDGLVSRPFFLDHAVAVAAPDHPLVGRARVSLAELAAHPFVDRQGIFHMSVMPRDWLAARGVSLDVVLELPSEAAVCRAARLGMGVAILTRLTVADDLRCGSLRTINVEGLELVYEFNVYWRRDERLSRPAQALVDLLCDPVAFAEALAPSGILESPSLVLNALNRAELPPQATTRA